MNWEQALQELAAGNAVRREEWNEDYLDGQFGPSGQHTVDVNDRKVTFDVLRWNDAGPVDEELPEADKAANDWQLA